MIVKDIKYEDFINYKKPSMFIIFPYCSFKCEKECGMEICQNSSLVMSKNIRLNIDTVVSKYINNSITQAIVCGGLEPFDSWVDLQDLIISLRQRTNDDMVIYTGYNKEEITNEIDWLKQYANIIVKFGRYIPNQSSHFDSVLGVNLASSNQYAERIS